MIPISKPTITEQDKQAVLAVLDSGMLVQGPRVAELEQHWAAVCGAKHAIATSNGTTALHVAMLAHGIGPGDEVITTPFTFIASVNSIIYAGATPVFVDICPDDFNINPDLIEQAITPWTKALLPVHLYGQPVAMDRIMEIAQRHNLIVIEDCAQAIGADTRGQPVGSFGTGCFSLYATKNVMSAEGGMITTNDDAIAHTCRLLRAHGMERRYQYDLLGFNFRLSDLHAAIGLSQLGQLETFTTQRRHNAEYLNQHIQNPAVITPKVTERPERSERSGRCANERSARCGNGHVWHQYTLRIVGLPRDAAMQKLTEAGVGCGVFYPIPAHQQRHLIERGLGGGHFPVAEQLCEQVLSLPVHPSLSQADLEIIVGAVNSL